MNIFKKYKERMIVALVAIILIVIISLTAAGRKKITGIESVIGNIITPIQSFFGSISHGASNGFHSVTNIFSLKGENEKLTKELAKLKDEVRKYENVVSREEYLRNEFELLKSTKYNLMKADVIGKDPGNWFDKFIINKGSKDGVKKGDIIIQATKVNDDVVIEGLVGRVLDVGSNWSKIISIIDGGSSVSFSISRNHVGGVGAGNLEGKIIGQLFDMDSNAVKGDSVYTSGLGGIFPRDIYIGKVDKVTKKSESLLLEVQIKPAVNFNKLRDIYIIKS